MSNIVKLERPARIEDKNRVKPEGHDHPLFDKNIYDRFTVLISKCKACALSPSSCGTRPTICILKPPMKLVK